MKHPKLPVIIDTTATTTNKMKLMPILTVCNLESYRRMLCWSYLSLRHAAIEAGFPKRRNRFATISDRAKDVPWPENQPWYRIPEDEAISRCHRDVSSIPVDRARRGVLRGGADPSVRSWEHRPPLGVSGLRRSWRTYVGGCNVTLAVGNHAPIYFASARRRPRRYFPGARKKDKDSREETDRVSTWKASFPLLRFRRAGMSS